MPWSRIHVIGESYSESVQPTAGNSPAKYDDAHYDPYEINKSAPLARKIYWFFKNKNKQRKLWREIEKIRTENNISVFIGVFSGVLPLMFYMGGSTGNPSVIFSDMDSWFTDVHTDMKKLWYRKYYSFNYALENARLVDFLSPYIAEGVRKRNINISQERISIAPSSFTDYSKCRIGKKKHFEICFCSRLEPKKNPMLFLEAASEILKKFPEVKFHLLGEGRLEAELNDYISKHGLESSFALRFHVNPPEVFAESSVFVTLQEGTNYPSQSLMEAMACGNAVIAGNTGDTELLVNDSNGILTELDTASVVQAMRTLIADRKLTETLGLAASKTVREEHTIEKMTDYYITLIKKAATR